MNIDFTDEKLCETLNNVLSGLLPHDMYLPETFTVLYPALKTTLPLENTRGVYYVFMYIMDRYMSLATSFPHGGFKVNVTRERFSSALENNLPDLILEPRLDLVRLMSEEGKSADITIPTVQQEAMGVVFEKTMALYDTCYDLQRTAEDAISDLVPLKDCIKANVIETGMSSQRVIMSTGLKQGRKSYRGTKGWVDYTNNLLRQVSEMDLEDQDDLVCNSLDIIDSIDDENVELSEPIGDYGIPQLDDGTPMLTHRFMVLVARENTGKTRIFIHLIASLIRKGVKVYFACGESPRGNMFSCIVSSYIFQEYGMYFETPCLTGKGFEELSDENKQIVSTAKARVATSGLVISNKLAYDTVQSTFTHYASLGYQAFFIDHSQSMRGRNGRKIGDLVTNLALDCRELKNQYPIYIALASHPSTGVKDLLQKDSGADFQLSPTAQSATPSQEADEVFILHQDEYLKKQGLLEWITYKRRGPQKPPPIYIRTEFGVSSFVYNANDQGADTVDMSSLGKLMSDIGVEDSTDGIDPEDTEGLDLNF